jgi:Ca2+-binding RTX toxin-like protein
MFENLENRQMFAVVNGTELVITGTNNNDQIRVEQLDANTLRVQQGANVQFFNDGSVAKITVRTYGGNDSVQIVSTGALPLTEPVKVEAGDGNDSITGGAGNDTVDAGAGNDQVYANGGNDVVHDGDGKDSVYGGDGDDHFHQGLSADLVDGGAGSDTVDYSARDQVVLVSLDDKANDGAFFVISESDNVKANVENVYGGKKDDVLVGQAGANVANKFFGFGGNDRLEGLNGDDSLYGGAGNDVLIAGNGNDVANGEAGNDTVSGNKGDDRLYGGDNDDVVSGGLGVDEIFGDNGRDFLFAADGVKDKTVNGGADFDVLDRDDVDAYINIDIFA